MHSFTLVPNSMIIGSAFISLSKRALSTKSKIPKNKEGLFKKVVESLKQGSNDKELNTSLKLFEEKLTEINELESIKKAKEIIKQAKEDVSKQNEAILTEVKEKVKIIKETTGSAAEKIGDTISVATKPVRIVGEKMKEYVPDITETEIAKKVSKTVSDAESKIIENTNIYQYGGFKSKNEREKIKEKVFNSAKDDSNQSSNEVSENPDAGAALVETKQSSFSKFWSSLKEKNPLASKWNNFKKNYDESNNVFVYFAREITDSIGGKISSVFAETDTARAMRELRERDPLFNIEKFTKAAREYIIPEILDAFLTADIPTLRTWCSEGTFNVLKANFEAQLKPGVVFSGKVLDLRNLELVLAKVLDDRPVLVFSFNTQQISVVKDSTGKVIEGDENMIDNITYVMALAREEGNSNKITGGWKLVEMAIRDRNGSW